MSLIRVLASYSLLADGQLGYVNHVLHLLCQQASDLHVLFVHCHVFADDIT